MRILLTGGTGYVGKNLIKEISKEHHILLPCRKASKEKVNKDISDLENIKVIDIFDTASIKDFDPMVVIHLAAYLTSSDEFTKIDKLIDGNIRYGTFLLKQLKETKFNYFINVGSSSEYFENPEELDSAYLYSALKTAFRSVIKHFQKIMGFKWINVIPYTIYGKSEVSKKIIDLIIDSLSSEKPVKMSEGKQKLDFIHISDVIVFFQKLLSELHNLNEDYYEFFVGTGKNHSLRELAKMIEIVFGEKTNILWGAYPYREKDIMVASAPLEKNTDQIGWKPKISLEQGLKMLKEELSANQ